MLFLSSVVVTPFLTNDIRSRIDLLGCSYNMPALYTDGQFTSCEGELQDVVDPYTSGGQSESGKPHQMTYEELRQLPVLDSIICEMLRLHPPIYSIMHKVCADISVPAALSAPSKDGTLPLFISYMA